MAEEFQEFVTFQVTTMDGREVEMAVMEEFSFENKDYVAAALVEGDSINQDGVYIYRVKDTKDSFEVEKIKNHVDYERVVKAYMELQEDEEE